LPPCAEANITTADAEEVLRVAGGQIEPGYCLAGAQTALQMLQEQRQRPAISLGASALDALLQVGLARPGWRACHERLHHAAPGRRGGRAKGAAAAARERRAACSWAP
jgi:hypothetical protein